MQLFIYKGLKNRLGTFFLIAFFSLVGASILPTVAQAATLYWVGNNGADASVASNWKTTNPTTCGSGDASAAPTTADTLNFDADCDNGATIDASFSTTVTSVVMSSGYTGTVTQSNPLTVSGAFTVTGGTWNTGSQSLTISGTFTLNNAAGVFVASSNTTTFVGAVSMTAGTFTHNSGTVNFSGGTAIINCNNQALNAVTFTGQTGTKTFGTLSACSIPIGASPVIPAGITLSNATLSGSGVLTLSTGILQMNANAILSGFSGLHMSRLTVSGATVNLSSYTSFVMTASLTALNVTAGTLTLPSGSDIVGSVLVTGGTLNAPSGTLYVGRNFSVGPGTFNHNNGTVEFDGTFSQTITGSLTFYNLKKTTSSTNPVIFTAGSTQTILGDLTLQGTSSRPITLQSSTSGSQWNIDPQGTRNITFAYVRDSNNINATSITAGEGSNDLGNNVGWTFPPNQYVTATDVTYTSTLDNLNLKMDIAYDSDLTNAPIIIVLHGYSGIFSGQDIIERYARKGIFAIKTYKRGFGTSAGTSDDSGREIYDFYDAIEYVKAHYGNYVDETNINVVGYSGGGGNAYGLITKFPDYFRTAQVFFGMSDYGYNDTYGWWNNGADSTFQNLMQTRIGGTPSTARNNYYARAHHLGAINNMFTRIQLFYDTSETIVPLSHATQYLAVAQGAGLSNVVSRTSDSNTTTTEFSEDFSHSLSNWHFLASGNTMFTRNASGFMNWTAASTTSFDSAYKKLDSLRSYAKGDRLKLSYKFKVTSGDDNANALISLRNSDNTAFVNALSMLLQQVSGTINMYIRADYNGNDATPLTSGNNTLKAFTTSITPNTEYIMELELNNDVLTGTLKDSNQSTLETQSLTLDAVKVMDGVDAFSVSNFNNGGVTGLEQMSGTIDDITVTAWTRWIHGYPKEGTGEAEGNITAENYFTSDILAGTYAQPTINTKGTMFVPGYVKTRPFQIMLGNGNDHAANLTYDISGDGKSAAAAKTFTLEGLTGTPSVAINLYNLTPNTAYIITDENKTQGGTTTQTITSDSTGKVSFQGVLGSIHTYGVYSVSSPGFPDTGKTSSVNKWLIGLGVLLVGFYAQKKTAPITHKAST